MQVLKLMKARDELPPNLRFNMIRIGQPAAVHPEVRKSVLIDTLIDENVRR